MEINHVLIVEDDKEIREGVQIYLQSQGYKVFQAADGIEGLEVLEKEEIHLAIIDIMMPRMDGIRMTMKLREKYDFPVIMLSAKSEEVDKITGLNIGADDYVTKPFTPMELMARVNSQLRRYRRFLEKLVPQENVHVIGGLEINEDTVEVTMDGNPVKLTPIEYKILLLLAKNPGRVFSSEEIYERVWQEKAINTDTIMVHVRNIREKIEIDPKTCAIKNPSLSKYIIESSMDVPEVYPIVVCSEGDAAPYGAKGIGEPALIPSIPATMAAIGNALGVKFHHTPILAADIVKAWKDKQAAEAAREAGRMIEVNTSGFTYACEEMFPSQGLLREFCRAGVPCTLGTDAHTVTDVDRDIEAGYRWMYEAGYREVTVVVPGGDRRTIALG